MADGDLDAFYESEYRQLYQGRQGPSIKDLTVQRGRAESLLEFTQTRIASLDWHLDIGCSAGVLMQAFQAAYGCRSIGIEPGEAYRVYAQAQGLRVYASLDQFTVDRMQSDRPTLPASFDLISLAHVLEHLPDPVSYLAEIRQRWLAPHGWLLIEVPNLYGHDCFEVAHMVSYSPHTLGQTLRIAGYQIRAQAIHGRPRSALIPLYITILAQPALQDQESNLEPEGGVRGKRRAALFRRKWLTRLFPKKAWLPMPSGDEA